MRKRLYSLNELEDIPGTKIFTAMRSRQAYHLHKFCMSLMNAANREEFRLDERAYLDRFRMSEEQKQAVLNRDFNQLIELGGNIYFLVKLASTDGWSAQRAAGSMTGMTPDEYAAMMRAGGRPIKGNRSIRGKS
jgi:protocatechuate 4,5-dioxygenase alpha chain